MTWTPAHCLRSLSWCSFTSRVGTAISPVDHTPMAVSGMQRASNRCQSPLGPREGNLGLFTLPTWILLIINVFSLPEITPGCAMYLPVLTEARSALGRRVRDVTREAESIQPSPTTSEPPALSHPFQRGCVSQQRSSHGDKHPPAPCAAQHGAPWYCRVERRGKRQSCSEPHGTREQGSKNLSGETSFSVGNVGTWRALARQVKGLRTG